MQIRETWSGEFHTGFEGKQGLLSHFTPGVMLLGKAKEIPARSKRNGFPTGSSTVQRCYKSPCLLFVAPSALPLPGVLQVLGKSQKAGAEGKGLRFPAVPKVISGLCFQELSHWVLVFSAFVEQRSLGFET